MRELDPLNTEEVIAVTEARAETARQLWFKDVDSEIVTYLMKAFCDLIEHEPERDQCGIPEHDYCYWCRKSMPNSWKRS